MTISEFIGDFKKGTKLFGETIGAVVNSALLTLVYFIGVGLSSIFAKMLGKHLLDAKIDRESETYWRELDINKMPMESCYRQF